MNNSSNGLGALKGTVTEFIEDECLTMAAAIAYYTAFSLPPLLVLTVTVAGWIWSAEAVTSQVEQQVSDVIGEAGWVQVREMMDAAGEQRSGPAAIVGIIALLFGATGVMMQLQASLNKAWEVQPDPQQGGVKAFAFKRLLSLAMIVAVAFLLLVSLVLTTVLQAMAGVIATWLPEWMASWAPLAIDTVVSLIIFTLLFGAMFRWLPDADVRWRDTWIGAGVTAVLFIVGKFALGLYFGMSDTGQYGAAASFVLLLLWAYYSAAIFLFGAEFTQVWARRHGRRIIPEEGAVRVVKQTRRIDEREPTGQLKSESADAKTTDGRGATAAAGARPKIAPRK
jgi:membrane protein